MNTCWVGLFAWMAERAGEGGSGYGILMRYHIYRVGEVTLVELCGRSNVRGL